MRSVLRAASIVLAFAAGPAAALPCVSGSLLDYLTDYASSSCEVVSGGTTFSFGDFRPAPPPSPPTPLPLPAGQTQIDPAAVTVTPLTGPAGLSFSPGALAVSAPDLYGIRFGFSVGAAGLNGGLVELLGALVADEATISVLQWVCLGGAYSGDPGDSGTCPATESIQIALAIAGLGTDPPQSFSADPPLSFFDVFVELTLDGGPTAGEASLEAVATTFTATPRTAVPEPGTLALAAAALTAMALQRRRRRVR